MAKRVLDVGNCSLDHGTISSLLIKDYGADVVQAHGHEDTLDYLRQGGFDLVLVNRKLDQDYSDGLEIVKAIKEDAALAATPVMLITNFPEYQATAVAAGAEPGFGKKELQLPETHARLAKFLK
jgi:CheY-like chemotaxis protein